MTGEKEARMGDLTWFERDGFAWFSDGSVLPMVRGGDGEGTDGTGAPEPAPQPAAPESAGPPVNEGRQRNPDGTFAPSAAAGGAADEPTFHDLAAEYESLAAAEGDTVTLPKDRISRWNEEHKRYRERWKPYEQSFSTLHPDDQQDILRFTQALNDPAARTDAIQWMRGVLDRLSPEEQQQVANAVAAAQDQQQPAPAAEDDFDPFDPAQIDARVSRLVEERLTRAEQERQQAEDSKREERRIQDRAKALGYADPTAPEYAWLLLTARNQFANDPDPLGRAHEAIEKRLNDRATEILKTKRADASQQTVPPDGAAPSGQQVPHSMKDAERAARERLDRIFTGQQS